MYRVDVLAVGETKWATNSLEFPTTDEAVGWAWGLRDRWIMVRFLRVVPVDHPKGEQYEPGSENVE